MKQNLYPMTFTPVYKDYLWGGTRIPETFNRNVPEGIYAESWEISDHADGMSIISNGELTGISIHEIIEKNPQEVMGTATEGHQFPLLIKLIDAKQKLSVQVHPNDQTAATFGGEAKTEMWYMLGDNPALVYCGLNKGVTHESFQEAINNETIGDSICPVPVKKEDAILVRGGRVHAIAEGCLILEIQQNANTTYRLFDWDRVGADNQPRELHINQAFKVINFDDTENALVEPKVLVDSENFQCLEILKCEYFQLEKLTFSAPLEVPMSGKTFHALFVSEGDAIIEWDSGKITAPAGTSILVPAALPSYTLVGNATILRTTLPE